MKQALPTIKDKKIALATFLIGVLGMAAILAAIWIAGLSNAGHIVESTIAAYFLVWALVALLSDLPREELRKRFALTTVTIISCLLLVEIPALLGVVDYRYVFKEPSKAPNLYLWEGPGKVSDEELVWVYTPHYRVSGKYVKGNLGEALCLPPNTAQEFDLIYDQHGFRNEVDLVKADIAVLGDSYVEAPMTPTPYLMTSVLAELEDATVANLGLSGYGPQQELATLKRYALPLNPKTIVWMFYEGNDLGNIYGYERDIAALTKETRFMPWMRSFSRNAISALGRIRQGCVPEDRYARRYAVVRHPDGSQARVHFAIDGTALSERDLKALSRTGSMLEEAYHLCRERGIRFVVVFVPERHRVYDGLPTVVEVSDEVKQWVINDLPERLRATVADISPDISYVDLTATFRTEAEKGASVFLPDDTHWTMEGHRIAAGAVHNLRVKSPILALKQHGGQLTEDVALMVRGPDGTIRYWNKGAEYLYGWGPGETLGDSSHRLLKTTFPKPLQSIEEELLRTGRWEGTLVHKRRDGSQVTVASHWELQLSAKDRSATVVEINRDRQTDS
jgi:PAS domain S-box-containing protein